MTVETEVANLTTAVDNLTSAVNVKKATLDAKVTTAQAAETSAEGHKDAALAAQNAAETAAASAVSVTQQDLSAISRAIPAGAVAICEINPWATPGDHLAWMHDASKSWYQEDRITTTYLGVHNNEAAARAVSGAADLDWYWNSSDKKCYQLNVGSGQTEKLRFGSQHINARFAVGFTSNRLVLVDEAGVPWRVVPAGFDFVINTAGSGAITSLEFATGKLFVGTSTRGLSILDFANDLAAMGLGTGTRWLTCDLATAASGSAVYAAYAESSNYLTLANGTVNAVAATVLPNAPADPDTGLPVPTIAVATDGGLSFIHNDGTVTSRAETGANMETTDVEFIGNSGAYRYQHGWSAGHDARVVYAPAEHLKDTSVLAYNTDLYQSWETPVVGFSKTTYHANALRQISNRTDPNGTSRVIAGDSMGGDQGITRVWHNEANPPASMVAYQADDHTTPPLFGDVKGAFLCERGAATLVGANVLDVDFSAYADQAAAEADGWVFQPGWTLAAGKAKYDGTGAQYNKLYKQLSGLTLNSSYAMQTDITTLTVGSVNFGFGAPSGSVFTNPQKTYAAAGIVTRYMTASVADHTIMFQANTAGDIYEVSTVSVDLATPDRSVNGKGAIINGTLTRDADGWVSGFNAANYLEQPYNPDLDFGTGDFYFGGRIEANGSWQGLMHRSALKTGTNDAGFNLIAGPVNTAAKINGVSVATPTLMADSYFMAVRKSGILYLYCDGILKNSGAAAGDVTVAGSTLTVGAYWQGGSVIGASSNRVNRLVIGAGAPSPAQIRVMANWKGDVIEGTIHDLSYVAETKSLWVLTSTYLYEIGPDGAERSKEVNDISATTLAAWNGGRLVS